VHILARQLDAFIAVTWDESHTQPEQELEATLKQAQAQDEEEE
jgi:hypothetical protein